VIAAGMLVGARAVADQRPALVLIAAVVLGLGNGACFIAGLVEVQHITPPWELGGLTALYLAATYVGFVAPYLLALLAGAVGYTALLTFMAVLAILTSGGVLAQALGAARTPASHGRSR
jgi:MFS family permease